MLRSFILHAGVLESERDRKEQEWTEAGTDQLPSPPEPEIDLLQSISTDAANVDAKEVEVEADEH